MTADPEAEAVVDALTLPPSDMPACHTCHQQFTVAWSCSCDDPDPQRP